MALLPSTPTTAVVGCQLSVVGRRRALVAVLGVLGALAVRCRCCCYSHLGALGVLVVKEPAVKRGFSKMRGAVRKKWPLRISSPCPARACVRHFLFSPNKSLLYREEGQPHMTGRRAPPVVIRGPSTRRRVSHAHRSRPSRRPPPRLADMHHVNPGFQKRGVRLQKKQKCFSQTPANPRLATAIFIFRAKNCH